MVAASSSSPPFPVVPLGAVPLGAVPPSAVAGRGPLVRFTVDDVQAMLQVALVPEDATTELLDDCLVRTDRSVPGGTQWPPAPATAAG